MPVLLDDDFVLWESNSICRYLARKAERWDLLPAEPQPAAEVEHWMDWQATEFNTAWRHAFMGLVRKDPRFQDPVAIKVLPHGPTACALLKRSCSVPGRG